MKSNLEELLKKYKEKKVHFVGIGGCGMSALALFLNQMGAIVSGSDKNESIFTKSLDKYNIKVFIGHSKNNIKDKDLIVKSSAISDNNKEIVIAKKLNLPVIHRSGLLADFVNHHKTIIICGAHGKTTTATLLAYTLIYCKKEVSYIVGGLPVSPMEHAYFSNTETLIIEADESDRSLLNYNPDIVAIINIDLDHMHDGGYKTKEDVADVIKTMAKKASKVFLSKQANKYIKMDNTETVYAKNFIDNQRFFLNNFIYQAILPGVQYIENCSIVASVAHSLGCNIENINDSFKLFKGVKRRFEINGKMSTGATVINDYSHHPTEIEVAIKTAKQIFSGKIIVIFQPHLFSRTQRFAKEFTKALMLSDICFITKIYSSRESQKEWEGVSSSLILDENKKEKLKEMPKIDALTIFLLKSTNKNDCIFILGAGDIYVLGDLLVKY